jgi:sugar O-acyltransferase (sialic acid O-acetyltransferase NeuD family)
MQRLVLIGNGQHALVVSEVLHRHDILIHGHLAPKSSEDPSLGDWLGPEGNYDVPANTALAFGLGYVNARSRDVYETVYHWAVQTRAPLQSAIHPSAIIAPSAQIGHGVFIGPGVIVQSHATVGDGVILNSGSMIEHHCTIAQGCHIATRATLTGGVTVGAFCLVGAGSVTLQGRSLGSHAIVGAGATVTREVADHQTVTGLSAGPKSI